jgi:hypothetical protein
LSLLSYFPFQDPFSSLIHICKEQSTKQWHETRGWCCNTTWKALM